MLKTDEEIMIDFQSGNNQAVSELFARYKKPVFNFALRIVGNRADAEDATAEVFLNLFKKHYQYTTGVKFSTWLYTIARNSCIDRLRKRKQAVSLNYQAKDGETVEWEIEDAASVTDQEAIHKETKQLVKQAIAKLDEEQRQAIVLREYQGLSYEQIAQVMGCSLEKIKILIFRARERLKGELASYLKEESGDE